uniref:Uncharacterized protein n=1 Tax=viral metagenome TaxID=1070528 RepID=A0A6C0KIA5_9ZZZZ
MENLYTFALVGSVVFVILKFLESKYYLKQQVPLKTYIRDSLLVYITIVASHYLSEQFNPIQKAFSSPHVFTNNPDF